MLPFLLLEGSDESVGNVSDSIEVISDLEGGVCCSWWVDGPRVLGSCGGGRGGCTTRFIGRGIDSIALNSFHFDDRGELGLIRHGEGSLGSVGVMEGIRVISAEVGMLEGMGVVDFMSLGEIEPEVAERLSQDELKLGQGVGVDSGSPKVGNKRVNQAFGWVGRSQGGCRVVKMG
jgi:hypothetical protein